MSIMLEKKYRLFNKRKKITKLINNKEFKVKNLEDLNAIYLK